MAVYSGPQFSIGYSVAEKSLPHDVVFLNGNLSTSRWWMPTIEELKKSLEPSEFTGRMIFLELPGCGESSPLQGDLQISQIVDVYSDLMRSLKLKSPRIVGHSAGGLLSCLVMAQNPHLFQKALLLDPVGAKGLQFDDSVLEKYEEMKTNKELTAAIIGFTIHNCDFQSDFFRQIIVEDTFQSVQNLGSHLIRALRGFHCESELEKIDAHVTVLFGEHDILLPMADAQALAEKIPSSTFQKVPGAGHCLNLENPKLMASYLRNILV